ncbi:hypothetical protein BJV74DRAFT_799007 [Russula compacta]|nr:hypothetical protein BJV74DRAFT_799007 [Russula compacta]
MSAYADDLWLSRGTEVTYENFPCDANPTSLGEKATIMPPFSHSVTPINIHSAVALVDSSFLSSATTATHGLPGSSSSSSSLSSTRCGSTPWTWWSKVHSGVSNEAGQVPFYSTVLHQEPREDYHISGSPPGELGNFGGGGLATPPDLDGPMTEVMDIKPGQYGATHFGSWAHRPILKKQRYERSADQTGGLGICDRRFVCTIDNCGKDFSGEWEKRRHIQSIHCPPTIGCRDCNYKQSRKDLFSEHCKKRHPGKPIENLMVQLVAPASLTHHKR